MRVCLTWANTQGRGRLPDYYFVEKLIKLWKVNKASSWTPTSTPPQVNTLGDGWGAICDWKNVSISAFDIRNSKHWRIICKNQLVLWDRLDGNFGDSNGKKSQWFSALLF
jgi:hypothetical protein